MSETHQAPPVTISETDARRVLTITLASLDWAIRWREQAHREGPSGVTTGVENWAWYGRGSENAGIHDRRCVETALRRALGLPEEDDDPPLPQRPTRDED